MPSNTGTPGSRPRAERVTFRATRACRSADPVWRGARTDECTPRARTAIKGPKRPYFVHFGYA
eukprot:132022-Prymnesium_polylepis.1